MCPGCGTLALAVGMAENVLVGTYRGISTFVREKEFTSFLCSNDDAAFACEWNRFEWCYSFNLCDFLASVIQLLLKCDVSVK